MRDHNVPKDLISTADLCMLWCIPDITTSDYVINEIHEY